MQRWLRRLIGLPLVGLLGFYPLLAPPAHRIDQHHFELIRAGMTQPEVESIFGQPADDYDWAVGERPDFVFLDLLAATSVADQSGRSQTLQILDTFIVDALSRQARADLWIADAAGRRTVIVTDLGGSVYMPNVKTWTSRHGACTIWLDVHGRVAHKSDWGTSRVEPPWSKWWKKCHGE